MKKISFAIVSVLTLMLASFMTGCTFKNPQATFSEQEVVVSLNESINLDNYLNVKEIEKSEVRYKVANTSVLSVNDNILSAKSSGKSYVYAVYENNTLSSLQVVVKQKFSTPTDFSLSEDGVVSWGTVANYFGDDKNLTNAKSYFVEGTCQTETSSFEISKSVSTNAFELKIDDVVTYGTYKLKVKALGTGYFDDSDFSQEKTFYYGFMEQLKTEDLTWNAEDGEISWSAVSGAKYKVEFDGVILDDFQTTTSKDISTYLLNAESGVHTVAVIVYDDNGSKLPMRSEELQIEKLDMPVANYVYTSQNGGSFEIEAQDDVENFVVTLKNVQTQQETVLSFANGDENIQTTFDDLEAGVYEISLCANSNGNFYRSDKNDFGKIYKLPTATISGVGSNELNGTEFKLNVESESVLTATKLAVKGLSEDQIIDCFDVNENTKQISVDVETADIYQISAKQIASTNENLIDGETVYVINSSVSNVLEISKLSDEFSTITHQYTAENKSIFTFNQIENASDYEVLYFNGQDFVAVAIDDYEISIQNEIVSVEFLEKIENLKDYAYTDEGVKKFEFKIVAKALDEKLSINSYAIKILEILSAPVSAQSGNSTNKIYSWNASNNADAYKLEIYAIDKETYENNSSSINIDVAGLEKTEQTVASSRFTFDNVGYYYVKIFALSNNENNYISSFDCLEEVFYIAEKLEVGEISFGKNDDYITEYTSASGYFVVIEKTENVSSFDVLLDGSSDGVQEISSGDESVVYLFSEDFSQTENEYTISIVAHSDDEVIYKQSQEKSIIIERLKAVEYEDMIIDELTSTLTIQKRAGIGNISIEGGGTTVNVSEGDAIYPLASVTNREVTFKLSGSKLLSDIYEISNNKVYLDSEISTFTFKRLATPTDLDYLNGDLTFNHSAVGTTLYYVLDLIGKTANNTNLNISVSFKETGVFATYQDIQENLGAKVDFISNNSDLVTIKLFEIINKLKESTALASIYNQIISVDFSVYGYQNRNETPNIILSSKYATISGDTTKTALKVEKMASPVLSFEKTANEFVFSWNEVDANTSVASQTQYQIYLDDEENGSPISANTASFSRNLFDNSTYYSFYVKATNPHYLESNNSNVIRIYKLRSISKLTLMDDGNLGYQLPSSEAEFCDFVGVTNSNGFEKSTSGKFGISISGDYTLYVAGKKIEKDGITTYYIDSASSVWNLKNMSNLAPTDENVTLSNNLLSWNAFGDGQSLNNLEYVLIFKDSNGKTALYTTSETSVNVMTNTTIFNSISNLASGDISIEVSAHLKAYNVANDGIIYFSEETTLLNGESERNYYVYSQSPTIKKLTTPEVTSVEFASTSLANAQTPTINISFIGNYATTAKFGIYVNDTFLKEVELTKTDEKYSFSLNSTEYSLLQAGETWTIKILANSESDIPSTAGAVEIERSHNISKIEFEKNGDIFNPVLLVKLNTEDTDCAVGGIVAYIQWQQNGEEASSEYKLFDYAQDETDLRYDLSSYIAQKLPNGGTIKVSAFINSNSNNTSKIYYLASPDTIASETYNVLKSVASVTKTQGGFVIDSNLNSSTTTYVVERGGDLKEVSYENGKFYFEFPDSWVNGTYDLTIYVKESGYITSAKNQISFTLDRIANVGEVLMQRENADDLSEVSLSWTAVQGAEGYLLRMYARDDEKRENLLYEFSGSQTKYSLTDIFGEEWKNLIDFGEITAFDLQDDLDVLFDISAIAQENKNNSRTTQVYATIKGNSLTTTDVTVDDYGIITVSTVAGVEYLYRFTSTDGTELQGWKNFVATNSATKIDSNVIDEGKLFNLEIIVAGSAVSQAISSNGNILTFDSVIFTTNGKDLTFEVNEAIASIGYNTNTPSKLSFSVTANSFTKIYAGLSSDALMLNKVISFVPDEEQIDTVSTYTYSIFDLMQEFADNGMEITPSESDTHIYFWSYREIEDISRSFVISKAYDLIFSYVNDTSFNSVVKMGDIEGETKFVEDYANTFVLFNDESTVLKSTLGMFIKIESVDGSYSVTNFVSVDTLKNQQYFAGQNVLAVNLTNLFENDNLLEKTGKFNVSFGKLSVSLSEGKFIVSDWIKKEDGSGFEFERLPAVDNLSLSSGNLFWNASGEKTEKFYVYFIQDLIGNKLGENYSYYSTQNTYFSASDFAGTEKSYYLAVQSINENPYVLSSKRVFVTSTADNTPIEVYKNQINSLLKLKDGKFFIDWSQEDDFYKTILKTGNYSDIAKELVETTFTQPFTFKLNDLLNKNVKLRIRFTSLNSESVGKRYSYDISAKYLLTNLCEVNPGDDIESKLTTLQNGSTSSATRNIIAELKNLCKTGSFGIANYKTIFDDIFETLQKGKYSVDYCLLGSSSTLNSIWYNFANENNENIVYVSEEVSVTPLKEESLTDKSINSYKMLLKKSEIYNLIDGSYATQIAENYVMRISTDIQSFAFAITKGLDSYSITLLENPEYDGKSVSAYECDSEGNVVNGGGYLLFYINQNEGNSLLGVYGNLIEKVGYNLQIYAVGNDYSASSKSEYFSLTLLGFGNNFAVNNGQFTWTSQLNRKINVIYKRNGTVVEGTAEVDGSMETSAFSLDELGYGLFDYVKFVAMGEIKNNNIFVDSEIYVIENVYKLAPPQLSNINGNIGIDDSANRSLLANCYSDSELYNYILYNNVSTESSYLTFFNENGTSTVLYETGTTWITQTNPDYNYKNTEELANKFYVSSVGTTCEILTEQDSEKYYIKNIYCKDHLTGEKKTESIAIRSKFAILNAKMMDKVSGVKIENGVLSWSETLGREDLTLQTTEDTKIIYKVTVVQYKNSITSNGQIETAVGNELYFYTANTQFDFVNIKEEDLVDTDEKTFLSATVQAFGGVVTSAKPVKNYVNLVEGGYASGNVMFADTEIYTLLGNGYTINKIDRLSAIDENSFAIEDGKLTWQYTTSATIPENKFFESYSFVVTDANNKEISGKFNAKMITESADSRTFKITFSENKGQMPTGTVVLKVFATQGTSNKDLAIKSFGREIEITKLATITSDDYKITYDSENETLDLSSYFENTTETANKVLIDFPNGKGQSGYEMTASKNKLYILRSAPQETISLPSDYVGYIVVTDNQIVKLTFQVVNGTKENCIYSDISDEIVLQRLSWGEGDEIAWDNQAQIFSWEYSGYYSLKGTIDAEKVKFADVVTGQTTLYNDSTLTEDSGIVLEEGTEISVVEVLESCARISYQNNYYYIEIDSYSNQVVKIEDTTLYAGDLFKLHSKEGEKSLIVFDEYDNEDNVIFRVLTTDILTPVYIIDATYGEGESQVVRTYTTTERTFQPTRIGKVKISIRIKLGDLNIQSTIKESTTQEFTLFASGDGTQSNPYIIENETQFKNISYRMEKNDDETSFVQNGLTIQDSEEFYFQLNEDINLCVAGDESTYLNGILFAGTFNGILDGNDKTVSYTAKYVSRLSQGIKVSVGNILSSDNSASGGTTFEYGVALFEKLNSSSSVKNLNISVSYIQSTEKTQATITNNSLIAGLVINNGGKIDNVNVTSFSSNLTGFRSASERVMMIYSGIASINFGGNATISNCSNSSSMDISDNAQSQVIFVSGIVYTNYATVENCVAGKEDNSSSITVTCQSTTDSVQVAGIAITNASSATIKNCVNNYNLMVEGANDTASNNIRVYIAGIADLGSGTLSEVTNNGTIETINIGAGYLTQGDIYATNR